MCGITVQLSKGKVELSQFEKMNSAIRHRGPDDEGYIFFNTNDNKLEVAGGIDTAKESWDFQTKYQPKISISKAKHEYNLGFGHRRLSIVDLSPKGHMPMCEESENFWITFNGEIYNYIEIKVELEKEGISFATFSDSEVLLKAYVKWGVDCLNKFKGMFSFAIFDREKSTLFLARDRFGIKPLYYYQNKEEDLFFASEIKQFTQDKHWVANLNKNMAFDFLAYSMTDHNSATMFNDVFQLLPGHYVMVNLPDFVKAKKYHLKQQKWYKFKRIDYASIEFSEGVTMLKKSFELSMNQHLRADVSMGSCLSGGIDSSAIVCYLDSLRLENQIKTFSAYSSDERYNEKKWVELVLENRKIDGYNVYPKIDEAISKLDEIIWHQDEPFQSSSIFMQWKVFELAKQQNVKVILDGQGADEILGGYDTFYIYRLSGLLSEFKIGNFFKEAHFIVQNSPKSFNDLIIPILKNLLPLPLKKIFLNKRRSIPWINEDLQDKGSKHPFSDLMTNGSGIYTESLKQTFGANLQKLLHWEDRNSMAFSIESRVPFLDHDLVELSINLPDGHKIKNGITKVVLREAMSSYLPGSIKNRKDKIGFISPEEEWFRNHSEEARKLLEQAIVGLKGIINKEILNDFDQMLIGKVNFDNKFWRVLCFWRWTQVFNIRIE
jgi:asparagine synthase (glutamine-hydrolysing)